MKQKHILKTVLRTGSRERAQPGAEHVFSVQEVLGSVPSASVKGKQISKPSDPSTKKILKKVRGWGELILDTIYSADFTPSAPH